MRKTATVTISEEGRDKGKTFLLTEMPASQADKWATRAYMAAARAGVDLPDNIMSSSIQTLAFVGMQALAKMNFYEAEPLIDELMGCVEFVPDPHKSMDVKRRPNEDDIEEVGTFTELRKELVELHTGFFSRVARLKQTSGTTEQAKAS